MRTLLLQTLCFQTHVKKGVVFFGEGVRYWDVLTAARPGIAAPASPHQIGGALLQ